MASKVSGNAKKQQTARNAVLKDVATMLASVEQKWSMYNSLHEGYGLLLEEVDELFDEVRAKQEKRAAWRVRKEALQVAVVGLRIAMMVDMGKVRR